MQNLDADIRSLLERSEKSQVRSHLSIIENMENTIRHFEFTYPELTTLVSKLMDSLNNAGI